MKNTVIIIAAILAIIILSGCTGRLDNSPSQDTGHAADTIRPDQVQTPSPTLSPEVTGNLPIDNISRDLENFNKKGWNKLYETNEFDCSRMTTFMWDYFRKEYKITSKIIVAPDREHAWLAIRIKDAGNTDRYLNWSIRGVDYYFVESTVPEVVKSERDIYFGNKSYLSSEEFYTTRIFMADDPSEANALTGGWSTEFRLTKPDLDKLGTFKEK